MAPATIAIRDTPPADLLVCPVAPAGFPEAATATLPPPVRAAAIRLATAYARVSSQLERLIGWVSPDTNGAACPDQR